MITLNYKLRIFFASLISVYTLFTACNTTATSHNSKHYSEETLQEFKKVADQYNSRDKSIYLIDSLYKTFPYVSIHDQYRYYDFRRELVERIRSGDRSYDTAISYTDSMIIVIEEKGLEKTLNKEYIKAFSIRAEYFTRLQRYNEAIRDAAMCKQLNREAGDSCLEAENTKTLSNIAIKQGNFPHAITLLKEALVLAESCVKDKEQFIRMQRYLDDMGFLYWNLKKYDSSEIYHLAAANYVLKNKQLMGEDSIFVFSALENIYGNLGYLYFKIKNYPEAEKYIKKTMLLTRNPGLAKMQTLLGKVYLRTGKVNEAEEMAEKATEQINNLEIEYKSDLYELQSNIANAKKQYEKALQYNEQFRLAKDTISRSRIDLLKKNPFVEYEQLDKKHQVELLEKDNRNQQNKTKFAIVIAILLSLLVITSFYLLRRLRIVMKKRAVVFKKLAASEKELKETMKQKEAAEKQVLDNKLFAQEMRMQMEFNEAIIQQRRQISDDMHDELSSSLAALKFYAEDVKIRWTDTAAEKPLSDITEEVKSVYQSARNYMHSLKTNNWGTRLSIIGFLKEIQQKFSEKGLMTITLNLEEEDIKSLLSIQQHDQLYHIIRESISNVIKHANATELVITVGFKAGACNCSIADNGIGFNEEEVKYGIGIESIKNRVKDLQGVVTIESEAGRTRIELSFPIS